MNIKTVFCFLAILGVACAADHADVELDIFWRTINFFIFAALVFWLFKGMAAKFFGDRTASIVAALEKAQERAREARLQRENAQSLLDEAKTTAQGIVSLAQEEAVNLAARIAERAQEDIKVLNKLKEESKIVAENKLVRTVVASTLGDILSADDFLSDQETIVDNLIKRVA